jgi:hypothetical protein
MVDKNHSKRHPKRRVKSVYGMKSKNLFYKYAQVGGSLEEEVEQKRKELKDLESQLAAERNEERKRAIEKSIFDAKAKIAGIQEKMKSLLKDVASKAGEAAGKLSSGIVSVGSKLSSGISSVGSKLSSGIASISKRLGVTELYNQYKNERAIKDYYSLKAKIVGQIEMLKRQKPRKDELCKRYTEKVCNETVVSKYPNAIELFENEQPGGVPRLFYK